MLNSTARSTITLIFVSLSLNAQQVKFLGTADKKFDGNKIVLYTKTTVDSSVIKDGKFNFTVPFDGPLVYHFYSTLEKAKGWNYPLGIMVTDPGTIGIKADVEHFEHTTVSGSKENELYQAFCLKYVQADRATKDELYKKYGREMVDNPNSAGTNAKEIRRDHEQLNMETEKKHMENLKQFIHAHPDAYVSMYFLGGYGSGLDLADYESLYNSLSPKYKDSPAGKFIALDLKEKKIVDIGSIAPNFAEQDTSGKMIELSSFRGKYVLLDFWASWCGPCRAENPNVVKVFNKFKDKGFTVLGVSLDQPGKKEAWLKAIHNDGLTWTHVSDLKFWNSKAATLYNVKAIPANFLLDKEGKIIAKDLSGADLNNKLSEVLGVAQEKR